MFEIMNWVNQSLRAICCIPVCIEFASQTAFVSASGTFVVDYDSLGTAQRVFAPQDCLRLSAFLQWRLRTRRVRISAKVDRPIL